MALLPPNQQRQSTEGILVFNANIISKCCEGLSEGARLRVAFDDRNVRVRYAYAYIRDFVKRSRLLDVYVTVRYKYTDQTTAQITRRDIY